MALSLLCEGCPAGLNKYREFVKSNPILASELESSLRWISYLTAGRFDQSPVISELIYSASSLLTLLNDSILRKAANIPVHLSSAVERLHTFLSVLEYTEVFAELAARWFGGKVIRWTVIVIIQMIKTALRLMLLLKHKQGIQKSPPISPLNRRRDLPNLFNTKKESPAPYVCEPEGSVEVAFTLKRSGRTIRTLAAAPPISKRTWKLPPAAIKDGEMSLPKIKFPPTPLHSERLAAEVLHVLRPLAHLTGMAFCGEHSWKPWALSLGMDMASLQLFGDRREMNHDERLELSRRALILMLYFLRSPFYDTFTKMRIILLLKFFADNVPVIGMIIRPLMDYLPEWQKTYFYMWIV